MTATRHRLFVYGTLRPGDVRWPILAPFAADVGVADAVAGRLFDTGLGYPAAVFANGGSNAPANPVRHAAVTASMVHGRTYALRPDRLDDALAALDHEEGTVAGLYRRVVVATSAGFDAWAYSYGDGLELTPIESGDWSIHRT